MSCILLSGYDTPCSSIGGIKEIYISTWDTDIAYTFDADGIIDYIEVPPGSSLYQIFDIMWETAGYTETVEVSTENGTTFWNHRLEITLFKINQSLINLIDTLSKGRWRIIILDNQDQYRMIGLDNASMVTSAEMGPGRLMSDLNGGKVVFESKWSKPSPLIISSVAEEAIYPDNLFYRLIFDPKNRLDVTNVIGGGSFNMEITYASGAYSYYGIGGVEFPNQNVLVFNTLARRLLNENNNTIVSLLDETGPVILSGINQWSVAPDAADVIMFWTKKIPGSNPATVEEYTFDDVAGYQAVNAPITFFATDGTLLARYCPVITCELVSATPTGANIKLTRSQVTIDSQIPLGYEAILSGLFVPAMTWQAIDFPISIDPLDPNIAYSYDVPAGFYEYGVLGELNESPDPYLPKARATIVIQIL